GRDPAADGLQITTAKGDDSEIARVVSSAIADRRMLEVEHYKESEDEFTSRTIEPYQLLNGLEGWYVHSFDPSKEGTRSFRLDRIRSAEVLDESFEPREGVEPDVQGWPTTGEVPTSETARVWVSPERARWAREGRRVLEELKDGSVIVELPFGGHDYLAREILKEAGDVDAAEDELFGDARGDELPPEFRSTGELRKRLREAKQRLDAKRAAEQKPVPRSRPERLQESKRRLDQELELERRVRADYRAWRARGISADGRRFGGREPKLEPLPEQPRGKINTTDPDSRNVKTPRSYTQGYNAQAVVNELQIVLAAEVTVSSPDFGQLEPMVEATNNELEAIGVSETPAVAVADTGYWHEDQIDNVVSNGTQVLIPPDAGKRDTPRPGWQGGRYTWMRNVLATGYGGGLYRRWSSPGFVDT
ncbi:MAG: WYL domain-containing protein, partial [Chloroflexota bacterium]|nr:WYL domain-containing protein [Chloroflexota bacterium]